MVGISNWILIPEDQPFEIGTNGHRVAKNHLKFKQKCPDIEWSGF